MAYTLFHYVHCPFCVRVRMTLGYLRIPYNSVVVPYDDEKTPVSLTGKKMLPILQHDQGVMNESLDIMQFLDVQKTLKIQEKIQTDEFKKLDELLLKLGKDVHSLAMPYWIYTPEFNESSRTYYKIKKELKRGPFSELVKNQATFIHSLEENFLLLQDELIPYFKSNSFGLFDILLASHLWGLYIVPEFQFPEKIHHYLQDVKKICQFNYHQDFWK